MASSLGAGVFPRQSTPVCSNDRLQSYVRSEAHCEYDNGYLVFDRISGKKEVWRLASDFSVEGEVAMRFPPDGEQMDVSARAAVMHRQYAPRGQFRPWALLAFPDLTRAYRLAYPTLICGNNKQAFLHDVRTGSLVQTIDIRLRALCYIDVNERHAFACDPNAVHVFSRESGNEILCVSADAAMLCMLVGDPPPDNFITALSVSPKEEKIHSKIIAGEFTHTLWFTPRFHTHISPVAHVSRDGRDLVIMTHTRRVVFIQDFERICRGETSLGMAGLSLNIQPLDVCRYLGFEHGRVCVATVRISQAPLVNAHADVGL